jgi:hypothetical protein
MFKRKSAELEQTACRALYDQARLCMEADDSLVTFVTAMGGLFFTVRFDYTDEGTCERLYRAHGEFHANESPDEIENQTPAMKLMSQMVYDYESVFGNTYGPMKFENGGPEVTDW